MPGVRIPTDPSELQMVTGSARGAARRSVARTDLKRRYQFAYGTFVEDHTEEKKLRSASRIVSETKEPAELVPS